MQELAAVRKQLAKNNKMKKSKASKEHSNINGGADVVHTGNPEKDVNCFSLETVSVIDKWDDLKFS